jgi:Zn/Cd-binding protein ZinT
MWEEKLKIYDELVSKFTRFERKSKTMPYTSANVHIFSLLNKAGEIGMRFSKEVQKNILKNLTLQFSNHTIP